MRLGPAVPAALIVLQVLSAGAQERAVQSAVCSGNEPFWRLEVNRDSALLSRPGEARVIEQPLRGGFDQLAFLDPPWRVWRGHATDEPARVLVATMRAETCFDSMSGKRFDHRVVVSFFDGRAEAGCCRVVVAPDPAPAPGADPATRPEEDSRSPERGL